MPDGLRERLIAVSNTGPLISAFQCGRVDLLQGIFQKLILPPNVLAELQRHGVLLEALSLMEEGFAEAALMTMQMQAAAAEVAGEIATSPSSRDPVPDHHLADAEVIVLTELRYGGAEIDDVCREAGGDDHAETRTGHPAP